MWHYSTTFGQDCLRQLQCNGRVMRLQQCYGNTYTRADLGWAHGVCSLSQSRMVDVTTAACSSGSRQDHGGQVIPLSWKCFLSKASWLTFKTIAQYKTVFMWQAVHVIASCDSHSAVMIWDGQIFSCYPPSLTKSWICPCYTPARAKGLSVSHEYFSMHGSCQFVVSFYNRPSDCFMRKASSWEHHLVLMQQLQCRYTQNSSPHTVCYLCWHLV